MSSASQRDRELDTAFSARIHGFHPPKPIKPSSDNAGSCSPEVTCCDDGGRSSKNQYSTTLLHHVERGALLGPRIIFIQCPNKEMQEAHDDMQHTYVDPPISAFVTGSWQ